MKKKNLIILLFVLFGFLFVLGCGAFALGYWFLVVRVETNHLEEIQEEEVQEEVTTQDQQLEAVSESLESYQDKVLNVSFDYPTDWGKTSSELAESASPTFHMDIGTSDINNFESKYGVTFEEFRDYDEDKKVEFLREKDLETSINKNYILRFGKNKDLQIGGMNKDFGLWEEYNRRVLYFGELTIDQSSCDQDNIGKFLNAAGLDIYKEGHCQIIENDLGPAIKLSGAATRSEAGTVPSQEEARVVYLQNNPKSKTVDSIYFDYLVAGYPKNQEQKILAVTGEHGPSSEKRLDYNWQCVMGGGGLGQADYKEFHSQEVNVSFLKEARDYLRSQIQKEVPDLPKDRLNLILDTAEKHLEKFQGKTFTNRAGNNEDNTSVRFFNDMNLTAKDVVTSWDDIFKLSQEKEITFPDLQYLMCQVGYAGVLEAAMDDIEKNKMKIEEIDKVVESVKK
ncbi:hypothetical protein KKC60_04065 [Patescibacteria group bacterium]|nr:hypothetical protein [Patescibacteria group bacterium]